MHAMLSNDYKRKLCCMAARAPAAFQSENTRVRPPVIDVFHVRPSSTARHTKCNSRQTRRGSASPQSAHTSSSFCFFPSTSCPFPAGPQRMTPARSSVIGLLPFIQFRVPNCRCVLWKSRHMASLASISGYSNNSNRRLCAI